MTWFSHVGRSARIIHGRPFQKVADGVRNRSVHLAAALRVGVLADADDEVWVLAKTHIADSEVRPAVTLRRFDTGGVLAHLLFDPTDGYAATRLTVTYDVVEGLTGPVVIGRWDIAVDLPVDTGGEPDADADVGALLGRVAARLVDTTLEQVDLALTRAL